MRCLKACATKTASLHQLTFQPAAAELPGSRKALLPKNNRILCAVPNEKVQGHDPRLLRTPPKRAAPVREASILCQGAGIVLDLGPKLPLAFCHHFNSGPAAALWASLRPALNQKPQCQVDKHQVLTCISGLNKHHIVHSLLVPTRALLRLIWGYPLVVYPPGSVLYKSTAHSNDNERILRLNDAQLGLIRGRVAADTSGGRYGIIWGFPQLGGPKQTSIYYDLIIKTPRKGT